MSEERSFQHFSFLPSARHRIWDILTDARVTGEKRTTLKELVPGLLLQWFYRGHSTKVPPALKLFLFTKAVKLF